MHQNEVILRAIGILTESRTLHEAMTRDAEADYRLDDSIGTLFNEMLPTVTVPSDATPKQAGDLVAQASVACTVRIMSAFAFLFSELASVHDAGRTDIGTADLLRQIALRLSEEPDET